MKGKLKFVLPLAALLVLGGAYKMVLAEPTEEPKPKVEGQLYVIPKEFLVNLADERYAKLTVALVLPHDEAVTADDHGAAPPEGWGTLPQEAMVRTIVTETLTGIDADRLLWPKSRERLLRKLLAQIRTRTDVPAEDVVFTDVAVQ